MERFIGINQRISLKTLDELMTNLFLTKEIDKQLIKEKLSVDFAGENRIKKGYSIYSKILNKTVILSDKVNLFSTNEFDKLSTHEKYTFYLCVICLCYPIVFDIIESIYSNFKIESNSKASLVLNKLKSHYGSNRSSENAFYSILRFFEEIQIVNKTRPGFFLPCNILALKNQIVIELTVYTYLMNKKSRTTSISEISVQPWFDIFSFDMKTINKNNGSLLHCTNADIVYLKEYFNTNQ